MTRRERLIKTIHDSTGDYTGRFPPGTRLPKGGPELVRYRIKGRVILFQDVRSCGDDKPWTVLQDESILQLISRITCPVKSSI